MKGVEKNEGKKEMTRETRLRRRTRRSDEGKLDERKVTTGIWVKMK